MVRYHRFDRHSNDTSDETKRSSNVRYEVRNPVRHPLVFLSVLGVSGKPSRTHAVLSTKAGVTDGE